MITEVGGPPHHLQSSTPNPVPVSNEEIRPAGSMARAFDYGSKGSRFDSWVGRFFFPPINLFFVNIFERQLFIVALICHFSSSHVEMMLCTHSLADDVIYARKKVRGKLYTTKR
jgi:hypothetical protein